MAQVDVLATSDVLDMHSVSMPHDDDIEPGCERLYGKRTQAIFGAKITG
jgi:hypothetical protein